jgi:hypothetical protein
MEKLPSLHLAVAPEGAPAAPSTDAEAGLAAVFAASAVAGAAAAVAAPHLVNLPEASLQRVVLAEFAGSAAGAALAVAAGHLVNLPEASLQRADLEELEVELLDFEALVVAEPDLAALDLARLTLGAAASEITAAAMMKVERMFLLSWVSGWPEGAGRPSQGESPPP